MLVNLGHGRHFVVYFIFLKSMVHHLHVSDLLSELSVILLFVYDDF